MRFIEQPKPIQTADYFGIDAVSQSALKLLGKSESAYYHTYITKRMVQEETDAMKRGTAFDLAILEPERAATEIITVPAEVLAKNGARSTNAYKEWAEANADKIKLTKAEYDALMWQQESVYACREAAQLLKMLDSRHHGLSGVAESENGLWRGQTKCELDGISFIDGFIVDVKTTCEPRLDGFHKQAHKLGYHVQAAFYSVHANVCYERHFNYALIVVGNKEPYDTHVEWYRRSPNGTDCAAILSGNAIFNQRLDRLGTCLAFNRWQIPEATNDRPNEVMFEHWMETLS